MPDREETFEFGDQVRHVARPEWGAGTVVKSEPLMQAGSRTQRLTIRFDNAGLKTIVGSTAKIERLTEVAAAGGGMPHADDEHPLASFAAADGDDWLAPVAQKKVEEAMVSLPMEARDPFASAKRRLAFTLDLYRFDRTGRQLLDWAVAQSGLSDPMTRFTRHELEQLFDRWADERETNLRRLVADTRGEVEMVRKLLEQAPSPARDAVRRCIARR